MMFNRPGTPSLPRDSKLQLGFGFRQQSPTHLIFISSTNVIGKTHLASSLSESLHCPWLGGDSIHKFADTGAKIVAGPSDEGSEECKRLYRMNAVARMGRMGIDVRDARVAEDEFEERDSDDPSGMAGGRANEQQPPENLIEAPPSPLILTYPSLKRWHREALQGNLDTRSGSSSPIKILFILLLTSQDMFSERFPDSGTEALTAETFRKQLQDIRKPDPAADEEDFAVVVIDGQKSTENQSQDALECIREKFGLAM